METKADRTSFETSERRGTMAKRRAQVDVLGSVVGEEGDTFTVRVTALQNIVVVAGAECEWRWPLTEYAPLSPQHSVLFQRVAELLRQHSLV